MASLFAAYGSDSDSDSEHDTPAPQAPSAAPTAAVSVGRQPGSPKAAPTRSLVLPTPTDDAPSIRPQKRPLSPSRNAGSAPGPALPPPKRKVSLAALAAQASRAADIAEAALRAKGEDLDAPALRQHRAAIPKNGVDLVAAMPKPVATAAAEAAAALVRSASSGNQGDDDDDDGPHYNFASNDDDDHDGTPAATVAPSPAEIAASVASAYSVPRPEHGAAVPVPQEKEADRIRKADRALDRQLVTGVLDTAGIDGLVIPSDAHFAEVRADELHHWNETAHALALQGKVPIHMDGQVWSAQLAPAGRMPGAAAKRRGQLSFLTHQATAFEQEFEERRSSNSKTKAETYGRYGW